MTSTENEISKETSLLIIDMQMDYFPGGKMELVHSEEASLVAGRLLEIFRKKNLPIYHINHISKSPKATFFIPDTEGIRIHPNVAPLDGEIIIIKHHPNSFLETSLLDKLRSAGIKNLIITGMMTHMCVDATVRAASDLGFECTVIYDACATRDLAIDSRKVPYDKVQDAFMAALNGTYAEVLTFEEYKNKIDTKN